MRTKRSRLILTGALFITLSDKRFPLPMAIAAMMLSYASAQSSVRNQLVNVLNKGQEYRRYENDDVPEAGHASLLTMAQRLVSSAFGSGFQKLRTTYQDIANYLDKPKSVRAVASAIGRNHIGYLIPCHRVIAKSGAMSGYRWGIERKKILIAYVSVNKENIPDT